MKLDYIYHSGFAIEGERVTVLIDYYKDSPGKTCSGGIVRDHLLSRMGPIYVLCSHVHPDHFNREVLSWKRLRPDIRLILSKDILERGRASAEEAVYLDKGEIYEDGNIRIEAFGSTDAGVSFLIDFQGKRLFHAGDLNNWHWSEESTLEEIREAENNFLAEVRDLQRVAPSVDVAMFPVDSRMGKDYMRGAEQFVERIKAAVFVPMHFREDYGGGNAFREFAESRGCRFITLTRRGERFELGDVSIINKNILS